LPKKRESPNVIVAANTKPGTVTAPEEKDDAELTLITAISAFGDRTFPLFITKSGTFDKTSLAGQKLFEWNDYTVRTAQRTFITEVLFIDWLQNVFIPKVNHLRERAKYDGKVVLILDGHASHVTPRVIAFAGSQKLSLIRLVPHSSDITQPVDLCVAGLFKVIYSKERQSKDMKGETKKMHRTLLAFYKPALLRWFVGVSNGVNFCLISMTFEIPD
jgi:hypothetical protein